MLVILTPLQAKAIGTDPIHTVGRSSVTGDYYQQLPEINACSFIIANPQVLHSLREVCREHGKEIYMNKIRRNYKTTKLLCFLPCR